MASNIYDFCSSIYSQTDKTVAASSSPELETIDLQTGITDSEETANSLFPSGAVRLPAKDIANLDAYNTEQAYTRIMLLYNSGRKEFYAMSKANNDTRRARMKHKKAVHETLLGNASKVEQEYGF